LKYLQIRICIQGLTFFPRMSVFLREKRYLDPDQNADPDTDQIRTKGLKK